MTLLQKRGSREPCSSPSDRSSGSFPLICFPCGFYFVSIHDIEHLNICIYDAYIILSTGNTFTIHILCRINDVLVIEKNVFGIIDIVINLFLFHANYQIN